MDENMKKDEELVETVILTDEDGNEIEFEIIGQCEKNGQTYFAMIPTEDDGNDDVLEYVILKLAMDGDEEVLVTVDDDDECDDIADYFDDLFSRETDYDA